MRLFEIVAWDSAFFGMKIGRIGPGSATSEAVSEIIRLADLEGFECLYWLVDSADPVAPRAAAEAGFRLVDIRITLEHRLSAGCWEQTPLPAVRLFRPEDLDTLLALARTSHRDSRFFHDGNFSMESCEAMFEEWLRKSCNGPDTVFVADYEGRAAAYCVCSQQAVGVGAVSLISVDSRCRRARLGTALLASAIGHFRASGIRSANVVTQGRNIASQRLYQSCGFVPACVELWFHRWRQMPQEPKI